jgi:DNA-binding NarL/FixJ family response regulator
VTKVSGPIRVLLADDHTLVRDALAQVLNQTSSMIVVADARSSDEALAAAIKHQPDVAVLDIDMPGVAAFDAAATIQARSPRTRIIFLSAFTHDRYIEAALRCGALGYVTKNEPPDRVLKAVRAVAAGQVYFSPEVSARLVIDADGVRLSPEAKGRSSSLSPREIEVLRFIAKGMSKKEIAATMHLSVKTVENHARVELARFAIREGLVEA